MLELLNTQRMAFDHLDSALQTWTKEQPEAEELLISLRDVLGLQANLIARLSNQLEILERDVMNFSGDRASKLHTT